MNQSKITKGNTCSIPPVFHACSSNPGAAGGQSPRFPQGMSCALRSLIGSNYLKDRSKSVILISGHMVSKTA